MLDVILKVSVKAVGICWNMSDKDWNNINELILNLIISKKLKTV